MRRCAFWAELLIVLLAMGACAKGLKVGDRGDPFLIPRDEFHRRVRILAVADVHLPDGMPDPAPIQQKFGAFLEATLRRAGYTVLRPQEYRAIWKRISTDVGGVFDASTGERDPRKLAAVMARTLDELGAGFQLDAVVVPAVRVVEAPFGGGRAEWDGTSQSIQTGGVMKSFLAGSPDGTLGALSLSVTIVDPDGTTIYSRAGGIEVLSKLSGKEFVLVPRRELFTDVSRMEKAVSIALEALVE